MAEKTTESLFKDRLEELGYPKANIGTDDIKVWEQNEFKGNDSYLENAFKHASKNKNRNGEGKPEFIIRNEKKNLIIVVECKALNVAHSSCANVEDFKIKGKELKDKINTESFAVDGALHYASFLKDDYDIIAVAVSGKTKKDYKLTSILWPKGKEIDSIIVLENGGFDETLMTYDDYIIEVNKKLNRYADTSEIVLNELKKYANACNNYLRNNGISANDRAGFVSGIVIALTDEEFKKSAEKETLGSGVNTSINQALERVWNEDGLPELKKQKLKEYYDGLFVNSLTTDNVKKDKTYFNTGDNKLSVCVYSIYENINKKCEGYKDLDIMGTFYTSFLKYAKGDAKDKGIVLTPKHITELFCDLAEFYLGRSLNEKTPVLDICTGTGGFLIGALNRMFDNIDKLPISTTEKNNRKLEVRKNCLIGVEYEPSMFALAYANMRFHKDGRSNLFVGSSLLSDKQIIDKVNKTLLEDAVKMLKPKVGMINPPYSQGGEKSELNFIYSLLEYLDNSGDSIGMAIVPVGCASKSADAEMRAKIMEKHTLLAVITMPEKLFFESKVSTQTCIMVFKAHVPHDKSKKVFLGRWVDDGYKIIPHNGRTDKDKKYVSIKNDWFKQLNGEATPNDTIYMRKCLSEKDEWIAEAYLKTDYTVLRDIDFENALKNYAMYKYVVSSGLSFLECNNIHWYLENVDFQDFDNKYRNSVSEKKELNTDIIEYYNFFDLFSHKVGGNSCSATDDTFEYPLITTTQFDNGVAGYVPEYVFEGNQITMSKNGECCDVFYQDTPFDANSDVLVLSLKDKIINPYIAMYLKVIIEQEKKQFNYSRKPSVTRLKKVKIGLPSKITQDGKYEPDWYYMENYIKGLPYSSAL